MMSLCFSSPVLTALMFRLNISRLLAISPVSSFSKRSMASAPVAARNGGREAEKTYLRTIQPSSQANIAIQLAYSNACVVCFLKTMNIFFIPLTRDRIVVGGPRPSRSPHKIPQLFPVTFPWKRSSCRLQTKALRLSHHPSP